MNNELLQEIGLNKTQARIYLSLIEKGDQSPPQIAQDSGESRSNSYMVLDQLEELGLAEQFEESKKVRYRAKNPVALEVLSDTRKREMASAEQKLRSAMPMMLSYFYSFTEKPGVRLFQGVDDLKELYEDILRTKQKLYLVRAVNDRDILGADFMDRFIERRVKLGIEVEALTPEHATANRDGTQDDKWLFQRTWIPEGCYEDPVEINVYGDKIALVVFGDEVMGVVVNSPIAAQAFKSLFGLIQTSLSSDISSD